MKKFKEGVWLIGAGAGVLLHNLVSGWLGREEAVFFGLTFVFLAGFLVSWLNRLTKNYWMTMAVLGLLGLDWAALDDITTGNEPNYFGEYGILLVSAAIFLWLWKRKRN